MRRPSLVTILSAAVASVFAVLTIWLLAGNLSATDHHAASVVVDIPDKPTVVAIVPDLPPVVAPPPAPEPPPVVEAPPPPPKHVEIVETIRLKLKDPALRKDANADDLAALERELRRLSTCRGRACRRPRAPIPDPRGIDDRAARAAARGARHR